MKSSKRNRLKGAIGLILIAPGALVWYPGFYIVGIAGFGMSMGLSMLMLWAMTVSGGIVIGLELSEIFRSKKHKA